MNKKTKTTPLSAKVWISIILFGLFGQVAWIVENMYFNVFMDRTVTTNPFAVQLMVAMSAVVATVTTLFAGTLSDRVGKRKVFISWGYVIWGLSVMTFALLSVNNTMKVFNIGRNSAITVTVVAIVVMDCVMTFFGSFSNDAAFNAWITDITDTTNRGKTEGVLAIMPLVAMALVFGGFDGMTVSGNWKLFFITLGSITCAIGLLGLVLIKDSQSLVPNKAMSFRDVLYGFKPDVIKKNAPLYYNYVAMAIIGIGNMAYMPYLITYFERTLAIANYIIPVAIIILTSSVASVVLGILFDKLGKHKFAIPLSILYIAGALGMMLASPLLFKNGVPLFILGIAGFIFMTSNLGISAILTASVRDYTPEDKTGLFQGVRMFFWVLLPMVIGPLITALITVGSETAGVDAYGNTIYKYPPYMFAVAAVFMAINIPVVFKIVKNMRVSKPINS